MRKEGGGGIHAERETQRLSALLQEESEREHRVTKGENRNYTEPNDGLRITGQTSLKQPAVRMDPRSGRLKMKNSIIIRF